MSERKLAHIEKIEWIKPIEGADNIELIGILGWVCIAKIGEFKVGDTCVYFEIDSKLPEAEWSEFMRSKHFQVKTMKLGKFKVISQGLALPLSAFEWWEPLDESGANDFLNNSLRTKLEQLSIGDDCTELLGVKYSVKEDNIRKAKNTDPNAKYNSMAARHPKLFKTKPVRWLMKRLWGKKLLFLFFGKKKDKPLGFPTQFEFVHKTDEERVENMPWVLQNKNPLTVSEKLDGTSSTYILERKKHNKFEFYVLSRNVRQRTPDQKCYHDENIYWEMALKYNIEQHLKDYLNEHKDINYVCIQGESVGNVQGNPLKLKENQLFVFNFINSKEGRIDSEIAKPIIESWGMQWVPILDTNYIMPDTMEEFKQYATAKSVVNPNVYREGVVLRDYKTGLSFKNVSREYLLKHNG